MKVMTVVGTRPEIIRLSRVIVKFDEVFDHTLVYTGQNWDPNLSEIFFSEMQIRLPDINLKIDAKSLGSSIAGVMTGTEQAINEMKPDAFLVLGDTNSALSLIMAKRMHVRTYHMEAGNRCFDERVPEETNRRLIDHTSDFNMVYTQHARQNLLLEGLHPGRTFLTGSPIREVFNSYRDGILASDIVAELRLEPQKYFVVSVHREETVDSEVRLRAFAEMLDHVAQNWGYQIVVSTHPRTRKRLELHKALPNSPLVGLHEPFGYFDFLNLQLNAKCVLSDSGTISEESSIAGFPAVTLRKSIERPEALESGAIILSDVEGNNILRAIDLAVASYGNTECPQDYQVENCSQRVVNIIESTGPSVQGVT